MRSKSREKNGNDFNVSQSLPDLQNDNRDSFFIFFHQALHIQRGEARGQSVTQFPSPKHRTGE